MTATKFQRLTTISMFSGSNYLRILSVLYDQIGRNRKWNYEMVSPLNFECVYVSACTKDVITEKAFGFIFRLWTMFSQFSILLTCQSILRSTLTQNEDVASLSLVNLSVHIHTRKFHVTDKCTTWWCTVQAVILNDHKVATTGCGWIWRSEMLEIGLLTDWHVLIIDITKAIHHAAAAPTCSVIAETSIKLVIGARLLYESRDGSSTASLLRG